VKIWTRKRDKAWYDLVVKDCLSRITPEEEKELKRLNFWKTRIHNRDPKMKIYLRRCRNRHRRTTRLILKLERLIAARS